MLIWKKDWGETDAVKPNPSPKGGSTNITSNKSTTRRGGRKSEVELPAADPSKAVRK